MKLKRDGRLSQGLMRSLYERGKFVARGINLNRKRFASFKRGESTPQMPREMMAQTSATVINRRNKALLTAQYTLR